MSVNMPLTRICLFFLGFMWIKIKKLKACDMSRDQAGLWSDEVKANVLVGNHVSFVDVYYFMAHSLPCQVGKSGLAKLFMGRRIAKAYQCIFVDRGDKNSRQKVMDEIRRRALLPPGSYRPVLVYPEGTTTSGTQLIEFKIGAFTPGVPVKPYCFIYPNKRHNLAWNQQKASSVFLRTCLQFANFLTVIQLPVAVPSEEEKRNPDIFAKRVRDAMAKAMGVPTSEHSYEDFAVRWPFRKSHVPQMFEFAELRQLFPGVDAKPFVLAAIDRYTKFELHTEHKLLTKQEFAVGLPDSIAHLKRLLKLDTVPTHSEEQTDKPLDGNDVLKSYEEIKSTDGHKLHTHLVSDSHEVKPSEPPMSMDITDTPRDSLRVEDRRKRSRTLQPVIPSVTPIPLEDMTETEGSGKAPSSTFELVFPRAVTAYKRLVEVEWIGDPWCSRTFDMLNVEYEYRQKNPTNSVGVIQRDQMRFRSFLLGLMSLYYWRSVMNIVEGSNLVAALLDFDGDGVVQRSEIIRVLGSPSSESYLRETAEIPMETLESSSAEPGPRIRLVRTESSSLEPEVVRVGKYLMGMEYPMKYDTLSCTLQQLNATSFIDMVFKWVVGEVIQVRPPSPDVVLNVKSSV